MTDHGEPNAAIAKTLDALRSQLSAYDQHPSSQAAKAISGIKTDMQQLTDEVASIKNAVQSLNNTIRTQSGQLEIVPEAAKRLAIEHQLTWSSMDTMDSRTMNFMLQLLGCSPSSSDKKRRARLRQTLGLTDPCCVDEPLDKEDVFLL